MEVQFRKHIADSQESSNKENEDGNREPMILTKINEDGTTSNYFDKRKLKIAPRSTLQFKVGPPFELVNNYGNVIDSRTGQLVKFQIIPRIDRGFDHIENEWVGYKRNYFTLVSSFQTPDYTAEEFLQNSFELTLIENFFRQTARIKYFAIKIKARSDDEYTEINLVQHTAKRDKGPQFAPALCPLIPSTLPKHQIIREASNVRNTNKMKKYDSTFYFHREQEQDKYKKNSMLFSYPNDCIQKVARYERVQFASSISVKKPSQQNRHFRLHVILGAVIDTDGKSEKFKTTHSDEVIFEDGKKGSFIYLQEMKTPPLIIRGRSPSNYTNSQRLTLRTNSMTPSSTENTQTHCQSQSKSKNVLAISSPNKLNTSPSKKSNLGRPAKRRSKVMQLPNSEYRPISPNNFGENKILPYIEPKSEIMDSTTVKVETLEHIEHMILTQLPLFNKAIPISPGKKEEELSSISQIFDDKIERQSHSRKYSIDLKDIELKPTYTIKSENVYVVGSLALNVPDIGKASCITSKKRKFDSNACSRDNSSRCSSSTANEKYFRPRSSLYGSEELSTQDLSLSIINNISYNFYQYEHGNILEEMNNIPRSMSDHPNGISYSDIDEESFNDSRFVNIKILKDSNVWKTLEPLRSEIVSSGKMFDESSYL